LLRSQFRRGAQQRRERQEQKRGEKFFAHWLMCDDADENMRKAAAESIAGTS
jgi:hypothetical protein